MRKKSFEDSLSPIALKSYKVIEKREHRERVKIRREGFRARHRLKKAEKQKEQKLKERELKKEEKLELFKLREEEKRERRRIRHSERLELKEAEERELRNLNEKEKQKLKAKKEQMWEEAHPGTVELYRLYRDKMLSSTEKNRKIRSFLVKFKGGKCKKCGYSKYSGALTFHHRDPDTKRFDLSVCMGKVIEETLIELEKCDLICFNCHREAHYELYLLKNQK